MFQVFQNKDIPQLAMEEEEEGELSLEHTPTWIVAIVCSVIVVISLTVERLLHLLGKKLKRQNHKPLFAALHKIKDELMLFGFLSLLLAVFQGAIQTICISESFTLHMLPCKMKTKKTHGLLTAGANSWSTYCARKGKVPLLSLEAIHQLHIFIFVLAVTHVVVSVLIMVLGSVRIYQWKQWEDSIQKGNADDSPKITYVLQFEFIRKRFQISWLHSFFKQFYGSVNKADYTTMRLGFITSHCKTNPKFDFHKYMIRALEEDFKRVVGIRWYLWILVIAFMLLDVNGWHAYFWIAFVPLVLLLAIGAKLEHVITQLAKEVVDKHTAVEGDLVVNPSDDHFWFGRPRIVLLLMHFILFQNAFEIAFFFWTWTTYGFGSCAMEELGYFVPRVVMAVCVQIVFSCSALPLYAIVTQMGSSFKKAVFDEHLQESIIGWAKKAKKKRKKGRIGNETRVSDHGGGGGDGAASGVQLHGLVNNEVSLVEVGTVAVHA